MKQRVRDAGVAGSNPATPTSHFNGLSYPRDPLQNAFCTQFERRSIGYFST
jgi:hypothetical protein